MREQVSNELVETINEFGPKMFEDFDEVRYIFLHTYVDMNSPSLQWRILVPSATAPPSSGQPGIWRRKSATGGVDAQGNLLVHPMVSTTFPGPPFVPNLW